MNPQLLFQKDGSIRVMYVAMPRPERLLEEASYIPVCTTVTDEGDPFTEVQLVKRYFVHRFTSKHFEVYEEVS